MSPEAQRIAIAKACGYKTEREQLGSVFVYRDETGSICASLPDYLRDLNAMHEAESQIHGDDWASYFNWIQKNGNATGVRATAAQRAEAFLRTKGLWKD